MNNEVLEMELREIISANCRPPIFLEKREEYQRNTLDTIGQVYTFTDENLDDLILELLLLYKTK